MDRGLLVIFQISQLSAPAGANSVGIDRCYFAGCGARMYLHRDRRIKPDGSVVIVDHYDCSTYTGTRNREERRCFSHGVSSNARRVLVLDTIRVASRYAIENKDEFAEPVSADDASEHEEEKIAQIHITGLEIITVSGPVVDFNETYPLDMLGAIDII